MRGGAEIRPAAAAPSARASRLWPLGLGFVLFRSSESGGVFRRFLETRERDHARNVIFENSERRSPWRRRDSTIAMKPALAPAAGCSSLGSSAEQPFAPDSMSRHRGGEGALASRMDASFGARRY
jgi:hypothetical protein